MHDLRVGGLVAASAALIALASTGALAGSSASGAASSAARSLHDSACHENAPPILHDGFPEPPMRYSRNGKLDVDLTASLGKVMINGHRVSALNYDGSVPGPTLVICAGDHLTVHFKNDLTEATNLHTHGFHVSPEANHDNVFLKIDPHKSFTYEYDIPQDMPAGSYWYHPHLHPSVEGQIFAGLAGAIVQEGGLDTLPALRHVPQRWIVIQNTEIKAGKVVPVAEASEAKTRLYVNGVKDPTAKIRPGELQRWRIFNADADRFVVLRLAHGQRFQVLAEDGHTLAQPLSVSTLQIAPGSRREVLVRGGKPGSYALKAVPFESFPGAKLAANGGPVPNETLLTLRSSGKAAAREPFPSSTVLSKPEDLRSKHVDRKRTVVFSEMTEPSGAVSFLLNGMKFDPNRIDVTMKLGSVEQWTLVNTTSEWHTFHIHTNDFQVVSVAGKPVPYVLDEDNVALPPNTNTVVLMHPIDFTGKFVFHCHVTFHEDHGMMATVQVVREPTAAQMRSAVVRDGGLAIGSSAYGSSVGPPSVQALLVFCRALGIAPPHLAATHTPAS
ncbi:MAG TPA: multicopper oxidase family protein [Solirubrobacteraceae bacterium]|jgi:FtsP/CotA-like multicopper oxidase with cupredoxin domain|nr:multicopper oxidase family protein [Solirubrobacteraceae bacterium]